MESNHPGARLVVRVTAWDAAGAYDASAFGSTGATIAPMGSGPLTALSVSYLRLEAGGRLGRHPASGRQWLLVVSGTGEAIGAEGEPVSIAAGTLVAWSTGEMHETRTEAGLAALILEGGDWQPLQPWHWLAEGESREPWEALLCEADEDAAHRATYRGRGRLLVRRHEDGEPVVEALWAEEPDGPELLSVAVAERLRGFGLGTEAVQRVAHDVASRGGRTLAVATTPDGLGFYLRLGFRPVGVRRDAFRAGTVVERGVVIRDQVVLQASLPLAGADR